ncbi:MAG: hypothetical protein ABSG25_13730 [Bryobacteraceae bacterium]
MGFRDRDRKTEIAWPIWADPLNLSAVATLLASDDIQEPERLTMARRGVIQVYRSQRFTRDKKRNFSPARGLL